MKPVGMLFMAAVLVTTTASPARAQRVHFGAPLVSANIDVGRDDDSSTVGIQKGFGFVNPALYGSIFVGPRVQVDYFVMGNTGSEGLSPDLTPNRSPIIGASDAAGSERDARLGTLSESAVTLSQWMFVAQEASRLQPAPPKPRGLGLTPTQPKPGRCSKAKGAAIGGGIGAGVGLVAVATSEDTFLYPPVLVVATGAFLGAAIGLWYCR